MKHLWQCSMADQAKCWCQPFLHGDLAMIEDGLHPLVFHRPFPGYVFHEYGEQGPQVPQATFVPELLTEEPVFENLDQVGDD